MFFFPGFFVVIYWVFQTAESVKNRSKIKNYQDTVKNKLEINETQLSVSISKI